MFNSNKLNELGRQHIKAGNSIRRNTTITRNNFPLIVYVGIFSEPRQGIYSEVICFPEFDRSVCSNPTERMEWIMCYEGGVFWSL